MIAAFPLFSGIGGSENNFCFPFSFLFFSFKVSLPQPTKELVSEVSKTDGYNSFPYALNYVNLKSRGIFFPMGCFQALYFRKS